MVDHATHCNTYLECKVISSVDSAGSPRHPLAPTCAFAGVSDYFASIDAKYRAHLDKKEGQHTRKLAMLVHDAYGAISPDGIKLLDSSPTLHTVFTLAPWVQAS